MNDFGDVLLPEPQTPGVKYWRATVVGTGPLSVQRDDGTILPEPPENFAGATLHVGDRVLGATINTRAVIIGSTGGDDTDWLPVVAADGFVSDAFVRRRGGVPYFRGTISGSLAANTTTRLGTVPAGFAAGGSNFGVATTTTYGARVDYLILNTAGQISARHSAAISGSFFVSGLSGALVD